MRFTTIWTLPGLPLRERINRTLDLLCLILADILPKRLVYWIAFRQIGRATKTSQNVPATSLDNLLRNIGNVREGKPLEQFEWHESKRHPEDKHDVHIHVNPAQMTVEEVARQAEETFRRQRGAQRG